MDLRGTAKGWAATAREGFDMPSRRPDLRKLLPERFRGGRDSLLEGLSSALAVTNVALEDGASAATRRGAVRSTSRAIRAVADDDDLWAALARRRLAEQDGPAPNDELLAAVADLLCGRQAAVLMATGYRPPPMAHELVDDTRSAVSAVAQPDATLVDLESARDGMRAFLARLDDRLDTATTGSLPQRLLSGRRICVAAFVFVTFVNLEVATGERYDVSISVSTRDKVAVKVTVPEPWGEQAAAVLVANATTGELDDALQTGTAELERRAKEERYEERRAKLLQREREDEYEKLDEQEERRYAEGTGSGF